MLRPATPIPLAADGTARLPANFLTDDSVLEAADAVAAIIVADDDRYLMQLRDDIPRIFYPGFWGCFGGAVGAGEDPAAALKRELHEELEFAVGDCTKILSLDFDLCAITGRKNYRHYYLVRATDAEIGRFALHEGAAMKLFTPSELFALPNVTPYDAFALWLHGARRRLR
jgi:8-oxo-dGTP pyrophosphatase MutT (NUDIX family)